VFWEFELVSKLKRFSPYLLNNKSVVLVKLVKNEFLRLNY